MTDTDVYGDTYSPVVQLQTVRVVLAVAAQLNLELVMMGLPKAFLLGKLDESRPIYMYAPEDLASMEKFGFSYYPPMVSPSRLASSLKHSPSLFVP